MFAIHNSVTICPMVRHFPHLLWRNSNSSWLLSSWSANGDLCRINWGMNIKIEKVKRQKISLLFYVTGTLHIYWIGLLKTAFADLVVAVYRCNLQSIWHRRWLGNLKHSKYREAQMWNWSTLLKLSSDSSGGHQDFLKGFVVNLWLPLLFLEWWDIFSPDVPNLVQFHISLLSHVVRGWRCLERLKLTADWIQSILINIHSGTDPAHHLVKTEQLLLRSEHRNFVVYRWTVESLHEVIRDSTRLKPTQA